jgi:hypothetical protein
MPDLATPSEWLTANSRPPKAPDPAAAATTVLVLRIVRRQRHAEIAAQPWARYVTKTAKQPSASITSGAPANGMVSLQSDDIDANPDTEPKRSDIRHLAILQPWHPPGAAEYGEIEH